jgi:hypothetical protein
MQKPPKKSSIPSVEKTLMFEGLPPGRTNTVQLLRFYEADAWFGASLLDECSLGVRSVAIGLKSEHGRIRSSARGEYEKNMTAAAADFSRRAVFQRPVAVLRSERVDAGGEP